MAGSRPATYGKGRLAQRSATGLSTQVIIESTILRPARLTLVLIFLVLVLVILLLTFLLVLLLIGLARVVLILLTGALLILVTHTNLILCFQEEDSFPLPDFQNENDANVKPVATKNPKSFLLSP